MTNAPTAIVNHDTYACPECLVPEGQAKKEHWRPLPPPHRAPLSRRVCIFCQTALSGALEALGAAWHPLCGPAPDPALGAGPTPAIFTALGLSPVKEQPS